MSIKEVDIAIRDLSKDDERIEAPGWCRYAAEQMKRVAEEADKTDPQTTKQILVWPEASVNGVEIHYAIIVSDFQGNSLVFNPNPTNMFPQYIGPLENAPGFIKEMKVTEKVV